MNERMWYYLTAGRQEGPVTESVLVEMLQSLTQNVNRHFTT